MNPKAVIYEGVEKKGSQKRSESQNGRNLAQKCEL